MPDKNLTVVFHGDSLMEVELIKGMLEAEGILSEVPGELATDHLTSAEQVIGGAQLEILVPARQADQARAVIRRAIEDGRQLKGFIAQHPDIMADGDEG